MIRRVDKLFRVSTLRQCGSWLLATILIAGTLIHMPVWADDHGRETNPDDSNTQHDQKAAATLLQEMNAAFGQLNYDGIFSYLNGNQLTTLRVVHKLIDGQQRERLVHLNGAPREIVRSGEGVSRIVMPGDDLLALEESIPAGPFTRAFVPDFERMADTYTVGKFGQGRIAGRMATRIAVQPQDHHRYGYRLWLDQQTSLLLRSELVDQGGSRLEIFMFNQLRLGDEVEDSALKPATAKDSQISHLTLAPAMAAKAVELVTEQSQWAAGWLPPGFAMAAADNRQKPGSGLPVSSLMYSDGLAAFSIFIEPMPTYGAASMVSQNGATVAVTHTVSGQLKGDDVHFLVTLVGDIPVSTARQIAASVYRETTP